MIRVRLTQRGEGARRERARHLGTADASVAKQRIQLLRTTIISSFECKINYINNAASQFSSCG